jgi:hypothetical protein
MSKPFLASFKLPIEVLNVKAPSDSRGSLPVATDIVETMLGES